ncbi:MAG: hypothetical protein A2W25_14675 [candidate division Zixibacteria bacterium RBG_16_53_22]|nr:MAG: hypothetical protein A2W25_14675 [candidate division Zixibacteria bacterium RBG_16_53_22]
MRNYNGRTPAQKAARRYPVRRKYPKGDWSTHSTENVKKYIVEFCKLNGGCVKTTYIVNGQGVVA